MTRHGQFLLQPDAFRADEDIPEWVHFPHLHLLLGWGPGLWETLDMALFGLRHVFLPFPVSARQPSVAGVMVARADYYQLATEIREHAPTLVVEGVGADCVRYAFDCCGQTETRPAHCPHGKPHVIVPDGEYRVRHAYGPVGASFTLERRTRTMKKEYRDKLTAFGLAYAPGVGKRDAKPDGQRTPAEQAFVAYVAKTKAEYVDCRTQQMLKNPRIRPADFDERRSAHVRARLGEMQRGKRDSRGNPKRPWADDALDRYTCGEIARREATDLLFEYGSEDICTLDATGLRNCA